MFPKILRIVFFVGIFAVIVLSVIPQETESSSKSLVNVGHIAAYAALAMAGGMAYRGIRSFLFMAVGLLILGAGLEFVQAFLPSRFASLSDVFWNAAGITLGSAAAFYTNSVLDRHWPIPGKLSQFGKQRRLREPQA